MSDDVRIKITAQDNATATLKQIQSQMNSLTGTVKGLAGLSIGGFGLQAAGSFLTGTVREFADAQASQVRLASVIKATGNTTKLTLGEIYDFAGGLESSTGTAAESIQDAAAQLARFRTIGGDTFKEVLTLANDMSKVLGSDVTSSAVTLAKALNSPAEGLSKLNRLGVTFNEVQQAQIKSLDELGMKAEAQAKILEEIRRQFGGAAADYGNSVAGQLDRLGHEIGNLKEAIGQQLAPIVKDLLTGIRSLVGVSTDQTIAALRKDSGAIDIGGGPPRSQNEIQAELRARFTQQSEALKRAVKDEQDLIDSINSRSFALGDDGAFFGLKLGPTLKEQQDQLAELQKAIAQTRGNLKLLEGEIKPIDLLAVNPAGVLLNSFKSKFAGFSSMFRGTSADLGFGLQIQQPGLGDALGGVGQRIAQDLFGDLIAGFQFGNLMKDGGGGGGGGGSTPSLSAVESRFLTRGRGQLSMADKQQAERDQKQLSELKAIKDAVKALAESALLVVEGVN